jgi:multiple sugar transport system ATP-binding protein
MVFQSYALYPSMTCAKTSLRPEIRKMPKAASTPSSRAWPDAADRAPAGPQAGQLSGGQRQRVAMGRAWRASSSCSTSRCPTWTPSCAWKCAEIKLMHQRLKSTIVYVTHDQIEAMTLGDRIAVMKDGMVQQFGTPQDIYDNPANLFVASFIGSPSMNFIPASLDRGQRGVCRHRERGQEPAPGLPLPPTSCAAMAGRDVIRRAPGADHGHEQRARRRGPELGCLIDLVEPTGPTPC